MRKFNPYRNIFFYYRGPQTHRIVSDQIEDNTTKALINTLEYSDISLLGFLLNNLKIPFNNNKAAFDLQVSELHCKPDALIQWNNAKVYIESKVRAELDINQINNHIKAIGKSYLLVITPKKEDRKAIKKIKFSGLRFLTWEEIFLSFSKYMSNVKNEFNLLIISQFLSYLESINMAPFNGFWKEDFDAFLYIEDDPQKEIRTIVKNKFKKFLDELYSEISKNSSFNNLKVDVGNLHKESKTIWGTFSEENKNKVDVPHYNFVINRNGFSIGVIVEGKIPSVKYFRNIRNNLYCFTEILNKLTNFKIELKKRVYLNPRRYRNDTVATLECGNEIKIEDVTYILTKAKQYDLILTRCYFEIPRDDETLNSKKFLKTAVKYLDNLKTLYDFAIREEK